MSEEIALLFPHQLYRNHPAVKEGRPVYLIEEPLFFGSDHFEPFPATHCYKLILHRASHSAYAAFLESEGHIVQYLKFAESHKTTTDALEQLPLAKLKKIHLVDPIDYLLMRRVKRFCEEQTIELVIYPSPNFLSPTSFLEQEFPGGKKPFMARFYQHQRQRMNILMDGTEPEGGQYSYDADNRKKLPKGYIAPAQPKTPANDFVTEAIKWVKGEFPEATSIEKADDFFYPTTHAEAKAWLDQFLKERFVDFGPYEDSISSQHPVMNHSVLTPMLNIGLLTPQQVMDETLAFAEKKNVSIPLNSLEGFIRQIIGWREFMFAMYERHHVTMRTKNFWGFTRRMPNCFYDATTGITPVDDAIRHVLDTGYAHHIERLMLLGNFMLLCRIHPDDVYRWFMELFIDAYDWVMVPNVYGMSQFADGGLFTTKPYLSGSNYVLKMSDYKKGDWCPIWDGLYWTFIDDHHDVFVKNHRLAMMARTCERMDPEKKATHRQNAEAFLASLD